jgi:hypothetical protein
LRFIDLRAAALKKAFGATDNVLWMRLLTLGLSASLLILIGLGCSSKSSTKIDGGMAGEAGPPRSDALVSRDARDGSGGDLSANEAGGGRDTKNTNLDTGVGDARDSRSVGGDVTADVWNRDNGVGGRSDAAKDVAGDGGLAPDAALLSGTCASPIEIPYVPQIDLMADTTGADHILDFPCVANGADIVFRIRSDGPEMVYAHTFGTSWNTALLFSDSCEAPLPPEDDGMTACNDDACGTSQSQAFSTFKYGYHYLIVSGVNGESGPLRLHFEHAMIGNGTAVNLPAGTSSVVGTTSGMDSSRTCDMAGPKDSYWWTTCPTDIGGPFSASTCMGANWDSALILQIPRLDDNGVTCAEDDPSCGVRATLDGVIPDGAGMSVLTVTGHLMRDSGDYTLTYTRP